MRSVLIAILAVSALFSLTAAQENKTCLGVALQGGGDRGAYEAGVLWGLVKNAQYPGQFAYDVVSGISAGSINAVAMMIYPPGQEDSLVEFINTSWRASTQRDIFANWPGGYLQGLLEPSLVDNDPELSYLQSQIYAAPNQRQGILVTCDANSAAKVIFTQEDWQEDQDFAAHVALFSSAIPFIFKYRQYEEFTFIDGGAAEGVDIEDIVLACREQVDSDSQITVDVIFCANTTIVDKDVSTYNGLQMYTRANDLVTWRKATFLYTFNVMAYPDVNWRYFLIPSHILPNENIPLDFKPENIDYMINLGVSDAIDALNGDPTATSKAFYEYSLAFVDAVFYNTQAPAIHN